jgi:methionyl-tRNA formyltransferase
MGTPQLATPILSALIAHHDVVGVVTQPDAPSGRGKVLTASPVKQMALQHALPVLQPESLKPAEAVDALRALNPDVIVVAAFGQILRQNVLDLPPHHCLNVHFSLLPRWRGASPVSAAIAAGDPITGVTIMLMDAGLDTGPMLSRREVQIMPEDTTSSLTDKLSTVGADLLAETLPGWLDGSIKPQKQDNALATVAGRMTKEQGRIDWTRNAVQIERHIRAMSPWPSAFTSLGGRQLKLLRARHAYANDKIKHPNGSVHVEHSRVLVQCGDGMLELSEVQLEGKRPMSAADFARGYAGGLTGAVLG